MDDVGTQRSISGTGDRRPELENRDMATRKQRNSKPEPTRDAAASRIYREIQDAHPLLTVEQERELFRTLAEGDEEAREQARETLVLSNLGLVAKNASRVAYGVPIEDLIQAGFIGLMRAIEKFEVERGHKFSTYATWWIRQAVVRAKPELTDIVHVPEWVRDRDRKVYYAAEEYRAVHGSEPDSQDLADAVGITVEKVEKARQDIENAATWSSLDASVGSNGRLLPMSEVLVDPLAADPAQRVECVEDVAKILANLEEREEHILRERFGVGREDEEEQNLRSIGKELGISGERARQIEAEAMEALRDTYAPDAVRTPRTQKKKAPTQPKAKKVVNREEEQLALFR